MIVYSYTAWFVLCLLCRDILATRCVTQTLYKRESPAMNESINTVCPRSPQCTLDGIHLGNDNMTGMLVNVANWRQCSVDSSSHQYNIHMDSVCSYYLVLSVCMLVYI